MRKSINNTNATANNVINMASVAPVISPEEMLARNVMSNTYSICGKRIASVPLTLMRLDMSYQRQLSTTISRLAREFNMDSCDFLLASYRDGVFYLLDGQHRKAAAEILGITELPCIIFTGLTREEEALIFARQNRNVNKLNPFDTYKANLACGDTNIPEVRTDMEICRICNSYGIEVKRITRNFSNPKTLRSISRARSVVEKNGSPCFEWILSTITSSNWNMCTVAYTKEIIEMMKNFYVDNVGRMPNAEAKLHKIMDEYTPMELIARAKADYPKYGMVTALDLCLKALM